MTDMISEERIVAYVDNALDSEGRAAIEAAAAADPEVATRIAAHRALRDDLFGAFAGIAEEPVPQRLIDAVRKDGDRPSAVVVPFAPRAAWRAGWPQAAGIAAAMAACLVAGIALTLAMGGDRGEISSRHGILLARGALAQALSRQLASDTAGPVHIALTFRDHSGAVCRTFSTTTMDGLACRDGGDWRIDATARTETAGAAYRQAASPLIMSAALDRVEGDVFDAPAEAKARAAGWAPERPK